MASSQGTISPQLSAGVFDFLGSGELDRRQALQEIKWTVTDWDVIAVLTFVFEHTLQHKVNSV